MNYGLFSGLNTTKRKVFISYHHGNDKPYYDGFINTFSDSYDVLHDNSVDRSVDSTNTNYVIQRIRDNYITGSSCTIVLCGPQTPYRKFVDWEIKATLDREHGLIGVNLPTNPMDNNNKYTIPDRLHDNIQSGYAVWVDWAAFTQSAQGVQQYIELANSKSTSLINNSCALRQRNG